MRIGVTSQNFRTVTGHAGKTRRFLVYEANAGEVPRVVERIDLPKEMSMHNYHGPDPHPVDDLDVLITASCGSGFLRRMAARGVRVAVTSESDPLRAAALVAEGKPLPPPEPHEHSHPR